MYVHKYVYTCMYTNMYVYFICICSTLAKIKVFLGMRPHCIGRLGASASIEHGSGPAPLLSTDRGQRLY